MGRPDRVAHLQRGIAVEAEGQHLPQWFAALAGDREVQAAALGATGPGLVEIALRGGQVERSLQRRPSHDLGIVEERRHVDQIVLGPLAQQQPVPAQDNRIRPHEAPSLAGS
jgi:hypothetical protein